MNYWLSRKEAKDKIKEKFKGLFREASQVLGNCSIIFKDFPPAKTVSAKIRITSNDLTYTSNKSSCPKFTGFVYPEDINPNKWIKNLDEMKGRSYDNGHCDVKTREPENGRELLKQQYYDFVQVKKRGQTPKQKLVESKSMKCMVSKVVAGESPEWQEPAEWGEPYKGYFTE